jgi:hypothetical protein
MARGRDNDGKYVRLTGLWPSKKDGLFSGKLRPEDIEKLQDKVEEAAKNDAALVFLLWENTDKRGRKDPDFTLQVTVSEDDGGGSRRGRSSGGYGRGRDDRDDSRDRDRDSRRRGRDDDNGDEKDEPEEETEEAEEEEEKPRGRKSAPVKSTSKGKAVPPAKKKGKDDDW